MCNLSNILNIFWLPKYKSKIERKIDALLTITDTLCTHISKSNLNNTSFAYVVQCAFLLPLLFLSLELFWALSVAWKKMSWKSVNLVFWCVRNHFTWLMHSNAFAQTKWADTLQVLCDPVKTVQHRSTVVVRVWGCSYMYSCELQNGKRVTYGGWKLIVRWKFC